MNWRRELLWILSSHINQTATNHQLGSSDGIKWNLENSLQSTILIFPFVNLHGIVDGSLPWRRSAPHIWPGPRHWEFQRCRSSCSSFSHCDWLKYGFPYIEFGKYNLRLVSCRGNSPLAMDWRSAVEPRPPLPLSETCPVRASLEYFPYSLQYPRLTLQWIFSCKDPKASPHWRSFA